MKTIPEASIESKLIYDKLASMELGEVVMYSELNEIAAVDVQKAGYGYMMTARARALREDSMVFSAIWNHGLQRLTDEGIAKLGEDIIRRTRKSARRGRKKLACADYEKLSPEDKVRHNLAATFLGITEHAGRPKNLKLLEAEIEKSGTALPVGRSLELFR